MAAALETATLSYRLSTTSSKSKIGLNSYYYGSFSGDLPFGTAGKLSFGEFLSSLQPSTKYSVLELDTLLPGSAVGDLWERLQEGTSIERDHRMRQGHADIHRPREVLPGKWMLPTNQDGGLLSALSPQLGDRSLHHHFALSASLRPTGSSSTSTTDYVNSLMQGMGIRYRPEQSIATILDQSLGQLTANGYGAGSYWKTVWGSEQPVLSVLGNSTRSYSQLQQVTSDMKQALSPRHRGYYNRDVLSGVLPEVEDCQEALASCLGLCDIYRPPEASGLVEDEEGEYFDA